MAKRKRDDTVETKDVNDKEEDIQRTVKWLCLHPLWSLRKDVLGNPNLLGLTASFLELKDHIALGKSHKSANQKLLKGDRGKKLKDTATYCCLCKRGWIFKVQTFVRGVGEFKSGYYCSACEPTKCDGCDSHYKCSNTYQPDGENQFYCETCYDELDKEEDEGEEEFTCDNCGNDYAEEDMNGDNCVGCDSPSEEEKEKEEEEEAKGQVCKLCNRWYQSKFIRLRVCYGCVPELELHK